MTKTATFNIDFRKLLEPLYAVMVELGGSATNAEMLNRIVMNLHLSNDIVDTLHDEQHGQRTELDYQLAWARTYLKNFGAIEQSSRGVWVITSEFADKDSIDGKKVYDYVQKLKNEKTVGKNIVPVVDENDSMNEEPWREELAKALYTMEPFAFERLSCRLLRECGFDDVNVTKQTGDGGIDGTGKLKINGVFSFNVAFQCKRYKGAVSAPAIRDFRGSLSTHIEKGIFITTGTFTREAQKEASDPSKQQIDLIDGEDFIDKLIECRIGVKEKMIFEVDYDVFKKI